MPISFINLGRSLPFSGVFRQLEQQIETVVKVLKPGPLGITEHKFSAEEIEKANATVKRAVENWQRNAVMERKTQQKATQVLYVEQIRLRNTMKGD